MRLLPVGSLERARRIAGLCLALLLASGGVTRAASALPTQPQNSIRGFYETLLSTMKEGAKLGEYGRYTRLAPVVRRVFDVPYMTRLAVGSSWSSLSAAQQQRVTDAFGRYMAAVYSDRFKDYSGERLEVLGERPYQSNIIVNTRIVKSDGEPVAIDYLMHQAGGAWRVADIYLDGTISQMATQRSEFHSIISRSGIEGLISELNRKVDRLIRNLAKLFRARGRAAG